MKRKAFILISSLMFVFTCSLPQLIFASQDTGALSTNTEPQLYFGYRDSNSFEIDTSNAFCIDKNSLDGCESINSTTTLPAKFDLRDVDGMAYVTPVKNQKPYGTCWAFSFTTTAESNYCMKTGETITLSPAQLAYYSYKQTDTPRLGLEGDSTSLNYEILSGNESVDFNFGGDPYISGFTTMSWTGLVLEEDLPYSSITSPVFSNNDETNLFSPSMQYQNNTYQVVGMNFYSMNDTNLLKQLLMQNGAGSIGIYWGDNATDYETGAFYNSVYESDYGLNHQITLIGWDDTYSKDNFTAGDKPEHDGAWIVQNSWGTEYGDDGIFYVSYDEQSIYIDLFCQYEVEKVQSSKHIYQYDGNASTSYCDIELEASESCSFANTFTATSNQTLDSISVFENNIGLDYQVDIYKNGYNTLVDDPTAGTLSQTTCGTFVSTGYVNIDLDNSVYFAKGETYSVVVSVFAPSESGATVHLFTDTSYDADEGFRYIGHADAHESFLCFDKENWIDFGADSEAGGYGANLRIKAYTYDSDLSPIGELKLGQTTYSYTGKACLPTITVKNRSGNILTCGVDYQIVSYPQDAVEPGTYSVTVEGIGTYEGTTTAQFKIVPRNLKSLTISLSSTIYTYNGNTKTPKVTVKDSSGNVLTKGADYTLSYPNGRKNAGTYTIVVTGQGNYTGSVSRTFVINPAKPSLALKQRYSTKAILSVAHTAEAYGGKGTVFQVLYKRVGAKKWASYTTSYSTIVLPQLKTGATYYVSVRAIRQVGSKTIVGAWSSIKTV